MRKQKIERHREIERGNRDNRATQKHINEQTNRDR